MRIENIISYYQDCYKQEFRDSSILNYLGTKVDERFYFENVKKLYQEKDTIRIDQGLGDELYKYMEIHKKEKVLVASGFFITGKMSFLGKKQTICAPLISTPVSIETNSEGLYYFKYNFAENRCNSTLLNLIKNNYDLADSFVLEIESMVSSEAPEYQDIVAIAEKLKNYVEIDVEELTKLPGLVADAQLKKYARKQELKLSPAFSVGIIEKSKSNRGVLNEIEEIKESHLYNECLRSVFSGNKIWTDTDIDRSEPVYVPSNLSAPQLDIIQGVKSSDVSIVIGPPGTGKSYTIASLAIDMAYHNKSVLICSKSDQAVQVLQEKIIHDLGIKGLSIRTGVGRSLKSVLKKKIESILHFKRHNKSNLDIERRKKDIDDVQERIKEIEVEIAKRERTELEQGALFAERNLSFFKKIKKRYLSYKVLRELPFWLLIDVLNNQVHKKATLIKSLILLQYKKNVVSLLAHKRDVFQDLLTLIKSTDIATRTGLFASIDFDVILQCLPIWITKSADISEVVPLQNDMFDVAIIDEASQCDIATMIPILARAKKIVVVGDPKQLRHVSFLSKEVLENTANLYGLTEGDEVLNYRTHSFLDYLMDRVTSQRNIHFLDEHYRSVPSIIDYSNHKFYNGSLKVMSDLQLHKKQSAVHWIYCNGQKETNGVNIVEADRILQDIEQLIEKEKNLSITMCSSIGVLSPFRNQVAYLKKKIEAFDLLYIKKHKIAIGTPFSFQGEERDAMFITFTIDNETSASVFQYLDREDVFNVSITRAKKQQYLYHSFLPKGFRNKHLLVDYFSESQAFNVQYDTTEHIDEFAEEVYAELLVLGIKEEDILINYVLAGYIMDIILTYKNKVICIDLVGYPGELEKTFSIDQYKTMFRTKVNIIVIPYAYWFINKEACVREIARKADIELPENSLNLKRKDNL
ncbi:DEAD/DEAH box helicase [Aquimarina addita]|uniref:DEAD/DEAH box helicase n=1 Tax=Aquimarina addita TaxID=870485 RepID=A0ABP6UNF3_9FLAO